MNDNNFVVSGSDDKTIRIWNLIEKRQEVVLCHHTKPAPSVAITYCDNYIVSGGNDNTLRLWNLKFNRQEKFLQVIQEEYTVLQYRQAICLLYQYLMIIH